MNAELSNLVWIPWSHFNGRDALVRKINKDMTITPRAFMPGETPEKIVCCVNDDERERTGFPIAYGLHLLDRELRHLPITQVRPVGPPPLYPTTLRKPDASHPLASASQPKFTADLLAALRSQFVVLAKAPTGSGKTVVALSTIVELKQRTLVVVPSIELAKQWKKEAMKHLGMEDHHIGMVGGGKDDYGPDKLLTIVVVHSLIKGKLSQDFLDSVGYCIWDEAHVLGADSFRKSMAMVRPLYRLGLTATPLRGDGKEAVFFLYFGQPSVVASAPALPCNYHVLRFKGKKYPPAMPDARVITALTDDDARNALIVGKVKELYAAGRQLVVFSDRIEHLQYLMGWSAKAGVPQGEMGLFTGQYIDENGKRRPVTSAQRDSVKESSKVIFATYGMMKQGIDIPRLDAGIEATPKGNVIQAVGRIRRPWAGKPLPEWYSIIDTQTMLLVKMGMGRVTKMRRENATIIQH